jgi:hypothetical protein
LQGHSHCHPRMLAGWLRLSNSGGEANFCREAVGSGLYRRSRWACDQTSSGLRTDQFGRPLMGPRLRARNSLGTCCASPGSTPSSPATHAKSEQPSASLTRQLADQNQPRGAEGSACPITRSTYSPVLFPSMWCSSYVPEIGVAVPGSSSLGPRNSIDSTPIQPARH